jgi:hypothetical protein
MFRLSVYSLRLFHVCVPKLLLLVSKHNQENMASVLQVVGAVAEY